MLLCIRTSYTVYTFIVYLSASTTNYAYIPLIRTPKGPVSPSAAISRLASIIRITSHAAFMNIRHSTFSTYLGLQGGWCVLAKALEMIPIAVGPSIIRFEL